MPVQTANRQRFTTPKGWLGILAGRDSVAAGFSLEEWPRFGMGSDPNPTGGKCQLLVRWQELDSDSTRRLLSLTQRITKTQRAGYLELLWVSPSSLSLSLSSSLLLLSLSSPLLLLHTSGGDCTVREYLYHRVLSACLRPVSKTALYNLMIALRQLP